MPNISLTSETAKREFMVSPLLFVLLDYVEADIYLEYPLEINKKLNGAVTIGDIWNFDILDRKNKHLLKDIDAFLVPAALQDLFTILLGILTGVSKLPV